MNLQQNWVILGSELSPFSLKLEAMLRYVGLPYRLRPGSGTTVENIRLLLRKERLIRGQLPLLWPSKDDLDEYPLVPFLFGPNGENLYDSSAIAEWLDTHAPLPFERPRLIPVNKEVEAFICYLIDEFADEFMLYLVHHNRWKHSAKDNDAGYRLAAELRSLLGPLQTYYAQWFSRRQIKRMPYLFSTAKQGDKIDGLSNDRQPPDRPGFPPTHEFLDTCYLTLLEAFNRLFEQRDFIISSSFTLADASIYGQFAMNLSDPTSCETIKTKAPALFHWLSNIQHMPAGSVAIPNDPPADETNADKQTTSLDHLKPLLKIICDVYVPLMHQNYHAWKSYQSKGETLFNEPAFWRNKALFDGEVNGTPYRSVVKTFQIKSWLGVRSQWDKLSENGKKELNRLLPEQHGLDRDDWRK